MKICLKSIYYQCCFEELRVIKPGNHSINSKILSGPAKNTEILTRFEENEGKIKVLVDVNLKLSQPAKILEPLIKEYYKSYFSAFLNRLASSTI